MGRGHGSTEQDRRSSRTCATSSSSWITRRWNSSPPRPAWASSGCSPLIREVYESASKRVTTGELNRFVESLHFEERKIYYITQASIRPPTFVALHRIGTRTAALFARAVPDEPAPEAVRFQGTPIVLKTRGKKDRR